MKPLESISFFFRWMVPSSSCRYCLFVWFVFCFFFLLWGCVTDQCFLISYVYWLLPLLIFFVFSQSLLYISGFVPSFFLCFLVFYIIGDMLTKSCLKFASFNVEGLCNKLDDNNFKNDISKYGFITLVETWLPTDEQVIF